MREPAAFKLAPSELVLPGIVALSALFAVVLTPVSLLPAFAVGAGLILLASFAIRADELLRLLPLGLALTPALAMLGFRFADGVGTVLVVGLLALMTVTAYRTRLVAVFGLSEFAFLFFALGLALGTIHGDGVSHELTIVRSLLPFLLAWVLGRAVTRVRGSGEVVWWTAAIFLLINASLGILEGFTRSDLVAFPETGLVEIGQTGFARPNGFLSTDIDFGLSMTLCVAVMLGGPAVNGAARWTIPIAMLGSVAVVLASFRTGWIALALIWLAWLIGRNARTWLVAGAVLLVAIPLLIQPVNELAGSEYVQERVVSQSNVSAREVAFDQAWQLFVQDPVLGVGLNGFQVDPLVLSAPGVVVTPHNLWLGVLAELGLAGFIGLFLVVLTTILNCLHVRRSHLADRPGGRGVIWACFAILPFSLTFHILLVPTSILLVGFIIGAVRGMALADGAERR